MALPWNTLTLRLMPMLFAAAMFVLPAVAAPPETDQWGLTEGDWKTRNGPGLRGRMGFPKNIERVQAEAKKGDPKAMAILAGAYATGIGVPTNRRESDRLALKASEAGLPFGHFIAALSFLDADRSGGPDPGTAEQYLLRAVGTGQAYAAYTLAEQYRTGKSLPQDQSKARRFLKQAADAGVGEAQLEMALHMFLDDPFEALELVRAAEAHGAPMAGEVMRLARLQEAWNKKAERLLVASIGESLVGAWTDWGLVAGPCVSEMIIRSGQRVGSVWIVWNEVSPESLHETGFALNGTIMWNDRHDTRPRVVFNLGSRQAEDPDEHRRMHQLIREARQLRDACRAFMDS